MGKGDKSPFKTPERNIMRKSSITLKHFQEVQVHHFLHNSREKPTINSIFSTEKNYTNVDGRTAIKNFWKEFSIRSKKYTEKTNKKLPKNTIKHISGIFNIDENTTKKQIENVIKYLEKSLDTKVIQYSIHKDEGHIDENNNKKINYHVHLEMVGLDSNGRSVRKKITRQFLRNLQTEVARILGMERGQDVRKTKRKRLDTYEYKKHKKLLDQELKQKNEEIQKLKKENEELKKRLEELEPTKEQLKKYIKMTKELRKIIKEINKGINLFTKGDYDYITKVQKDIRNNNYTTINELNNNINNLMIFFIKKLEDKQQYIQLLEKKLKETGLSTNTYMGM